MTDNVVKLLSPVKSPLSIDEIMLLDICLCVPHELSTSHKDQIVVTDSVVKLSSPVKSPLSIDEILL
jgi:hypothetical protein